MIHLDGGDPTAMLGAGFDAPNVRAGPADDPNVRLEVRATTVPPQLVAAPGANDPFDGAWMRRIERLGYERALGAAPWDCEPSVYERPAPAPGARQPAAR